jgi:plasmid stability protein
MKNITITLDEKTAAWVRVHAAKQGKSASRLLGELLRRHMSGMADRKFNAPIQADPCSRKRPDGEPEPAVDRPCPANPPARAIALHLGVQPCGRGDAERDPLEVEHVERPVRCGNE